MISLKLSFCGVFNVREGSGKLEKLTRLTANSQTMAKRQEVPQPPRRCTEAGRPFQSKCA